jgi:transposase
VERLVKNIKGDLVTQSLVDEILYAIEDIQRLSDRISEIESLLRPMMSRLAPELLAMRGVSTVTAAGLVGHAGNLKNCRNADAFAMRAGTAPVSCSSGKHAAVRLNLGGNRKLNSLLHSIAIHQLRAETHPSRLYYDRKRSEGKTQRAALRALKRRLSVVVYYRLLAVTIGTSLQVLDARHRHRRSELAQQSRKVAEKRPSLPSRMRLPACRVWATL